MSKTKEKKDLTALRQEALDAYMNREDFQFDINADALYRQYQDRYQKLGRQAMEDTMGQAASLTGGYGSSYAQQVGHQAYQKHLEGLTDVIPELYQLAYERYQDQTEALYRNYQTYDQQLQQEREQALKQQEQELKWQEQELKRQEQEWKQQQQEKEAAYGNGKPYDDTYYSWLSYHQGKGERTASYDPTIKISYDNGNLSTGDIMTLQRVLGLEETGMWTLTDKSKSGGLTATDAWNAYIKGQLQMRSPVTQTPPTANIRAMERALRLKDDGVWSEADRKAAGGLSAIQAWQEYQKGLLQNRRS